MTRRPPVDRIGRAIVEGLNEGGDKTRTQVQRALKVQTGVSKYSSITSRMADSGKGWARAAPGRLQYVIVAKGKGLPIKEFPARLAKAVIAKPWGVAHVFKRSFGLKGGGVDGFRARLGPKRFPIRKLYGPSLPKEIIQGDAAVVFESSAEAFVPAAVIKRLGRVLG